MLGDDRLAVALLQVDDAVEPLLEGIVMADDEQLIEAAHTPDLLGQIATPLAIHILRRLVEEGDVEAREASEQRQPYRQRRTHLLAAAELGEGALAPISPEDDLVISLPGKLGGAVAQDLAEDAVGLA